MIDFCLFPVSQVRALQYLSYSHAPPGAPALRIAWLFMPGARALAHRRHDEQSASNLIEFFRTVATFGLVAWQVAGSIWE
jgi:hypothetical protein